MKRLLNLLEDGYFLAIALPITYCLLGLISIVTLGAVRSYDPICQKDIGLIYKDFFDEE